MLSYYFVIILISTIWAIYIMLQINLNFNYNSMMKTFLFVLRWNKIFFFYWFKDLKDVCKKSIFFHHCKELQLWGNFQGGKK